MESSLSNNNVRYQQMNIIADESGLTDVPQGNWSSNSSLCLDDISRFLRDIPYEEALQGVANL